MPNFNSIGSGVLAPQVAENRYLSLTGGIAVTTVYTLTCYTVINGKSQLQDIDLIALFWCVVTAMKYLCDGKTSPVTCHVSGLPTIFGNRVLHLTAHGTGQLLTYLLLTIIAGEY